MNFGGDKYFGPGNRMNKGRPLNAVDRAARKHDFYYKKHGFWSYLKHNKGDDELIASLEKSPLLAKTWRYRVGLRYFKAKRALWGGAPKKLMDGGSYDHAIQRAKYGWGDNQMYPGQKRKPNIEYYGPPNKKNGPPKPTPKPNPGPTPPPPDLPSNIPISNMGRKRVAGKRFPRGRSTKRVKGKKRSRVVKRRKMRRKGESFANRVASVTKPPQSLMIEGNHSYAFPVNTVPMVDVGMNLAGKWPFGGYTHITGMLANCLPNTVAQNPTGTDTYVDGRDYRILKMSRKYEMVNLSTARLFVHKYVLVPKTYMTEEFVFSALQTYLTNSASSPSYGTDFSIFKITAGSNGMAFQVGPSLGNNFQNTTFMDLPVLRKHLAKQFKISRQKVELAPGQHWKWSHSLKPFKFNSFSYNGTVQNGVYPRRTKYEFIVTWGQNGRDSNAVNVAGSAMEAPTNYSINHRDHCIATGTNSYIPQDRIIAPNAYIFQVTAATVAGNVPTVLGSTEVNTEADSVYNVGAENNIPAAAV